MSTSANASATSAPHSSASAAAYVLSDAQVQHYHDQGFVIARGVFSPAECAAVIAHELDLQAGRTTFEGFKPRQPDDWGRTMNQHFHDPIAMNLLLHPRLRRPLEQLIGGAVDGVQTMYFYKGSEQRRHQDSYYLPDCMSAWCAMTDVGERNGTIWVQPGSHRRKLLTKDDFKHLFKTPADNPISIGAAYNDGVDAQFATNALPEIPVLANAGDVVLFHGSLIHRGGPIGEPGSFRHVMANHYIPHAATTWPYGDWPRYSFDGEKRFTTSVA